MAKALVCNLCAANGKATFATLHAEGRVGVGKRARQFAADFCDEHGNVFAELLNPNARQMDVPAQRQSSQESSHAQATWQAALLKALATFTEPVGQPEWYAATAGRPNRKDYAVKKAYEALRSNGLVKMTGTRGGASYNLTAKGKAALAEKKKAPAAKAASAPPEQRAARSRRLRRVPGQTGRRRHRR